MREKQIITDPDVIEELCRIGLNDMKIRTGWEFPEDIENEMIDIFIECGMDISNGLSYIFDNAYVNGDWGYISEMDEDASKDEDDFLFYDMEKDIYIRYL